MKKKQNNGMPTPLYASCSSGSTDCVLKLISAGANVNIVNHEGTSAVSEAAGRGWWQIVEILIANGAVINDENRDGFTPLTFAILSGPMIPSSDRLKTMEILIAARVSLTLSKITPMENCLHKLITMGISYSVNEMLEMIELLVRKGVDVNEYSSIGKTIVHYICEYYRNDNQRQILDKLISLGASIDAQDTDLGDTALHGACSRNRVDIATELILKGASADIRNKRNKRPLEMLFGIQKDEMRQTLVAVIESVTQ